MMGGEDFSYMMHAVPDSLLAFVGIGNPEKGTDEPHHSGRFQIDEDCPRKLRGLLRPVCP